MTADRAPLTDEHGTEHRYGCTRPGWTSNTPRRAGVHVIRCADCGAVRLVRARTTEPTRETAP